MCGSKQPLNTVSHKNHKQPAMADLSGNMLFKHASVCVDADILIYTQPLVKHQLSLWCRFPENRLSFSESRGQSSSAVLNLSCFPTYKPSLQSKEHNVQFFNGSRPRHSGSLLWALPRCKHLIKIGCASTIAANAIREPQAFEVLPAEAFPSPG